MEQLDDIHMDEFDRQTVLSHFTEAVARAAFFAEHAISAGIDDEDRTYLRRSVAGRDARLDTSVDPVAAITQAWMPTATPDTAYVAAREPADVAEGRTRLLPVPSPATTPLAEPDDLRARRIGRFARELSRLAALADQVTDLHLSADEVEALHREVELCDTRNDPSDYFLETVSRACYSAEEWPEVIDNAAQMKANVDAAHDAVLDGLQEQIDQIKSLRATCKSLEESIKHEQARTKKYRTRAEQWQQRAQRAEAQLARSWWQRLTS